MSRLILCAFLIGFVAASDVIELTDSNFASSLENEPVALVEFFAPWCGHCKRLAPEYEKAATSLKSEEVPVVLAKVDCTANQETCTKYGVSGYPTLKIFRNGEFSKEYSGPREADGIIKVMRGESGPSAKELKSQQDINKFLSSQDAVVLAYISTGNDKLKELFTKVADGLKEDLSFAYIQDEKFFGINKDKVVLHRPKRLHSKFEPEFLSFDASDSKELRESLLKNVHGLVGHRTIANAGAFKGPLVTVYYDVDYTKNPKGSNYWRNRILKIASQQIEKVQDNLNFAIASMHEFAQELTEFGLEADADRKTPVAAIRDEKQRKFALKDFSLENFEKFVLDFLEDKLEPYMKSEALPEDNTKPVKIAVGKNFDELVNDASKDVLIEFYAPWCGHCKKLTPIYDELAEKLKDEPEITIAKMDATANDVPAPYDVKGFPTIYFAPKGDKKNPRQYNGAREVDDFIKYLAKESTNQLKGFDRKGKATPVKSEL